MVENTKSWKEEKRTKVKIGQRDFSQSGWALKYTLLTKWNIYLTEGSISTEETKIDSIEKLILSRYIILLDTKNDIQWQTSLVLPKFRNSVPKLTKEIYCNPLLLCLMLLSN